MKSFLFVICLLFPTLYIQPVFCQAWETLAKEFETLQGAKRYEEALVVAEKALEVAEEQFTIDSREYHKSLQNLALSYQAAGRWEKSLDSHKELMRREISRVAKLDVNMSATIQSIIRLYDFLYDKKSASLVYQQAAARLARLTKIDNTVYTELSDYYTRAVMAQAPPTVAQALDMGSRIAGVDQSALTKYANQYPENTLSANARQSPSTSVFPDQKNVSLKALIDRCSQSKLHSNISRIYHTLHRGERRG